MFSSSVLNLPYKTSCSLIKLQFIEMSFNPNSSLHQYYKEVFDSVDVFKTGTLNNSDFYEAMHKIYDKSLPNKLLIGLMFKDLPKHGGLLNLQQFIDIVEEFNKPPDIGKAFKSFDPGKERVPVRSFRYVLKKYGEEVSVEAHSKFLCNADIHGDGTANFLDFLFEIADVE